jgi:hypothetical protein
MLTRFLLFSLPLVLGFSTAIWGEDFSFDRPRPLMALCAELGEKYGVLINYEDAPFDPVSELNTEIHPRTHAAILSPKWRPITFHLPPSLPSLADRAALQAGDRALDNSQALAAIEKLVDQYNSSGNPGTFKVVPDGNALHIEQIARMVSGRLQPFEPVSNTIVSWKSSPKSCQQVLGDLFSAMQTQRGVRFAEGSVPIGGLLTHRCNVDAGSVTMRQVLERILSGLETDPVTGEDLSSPDGGYSWQLVYEPNWNKYFLNIQAVQRNITVSPAESAGAEPPAVNTGSGGRLKRQGVPAPVHPEN